MTDQGKQRFKATGTPPVMSTDELRLSGRWVGIRFKIGTYLPWLLPEGLRDGRDANLPEATTRSFWFNGSAIEYPAFDHAETFIARLLMSSACRVTTIRHI
ncbi:MAG TPA: hypothetical protein VNZ26_11810 [Vicinamibacterales bacterium]|nr:hypothetical protein [Vicinamibacterales bacterium]